MTLLPPTPNQPPLPEAEATVQRHGNECSVSFVKGEPSDLRRFAVYLNELADELERDE